MEEHEIEFSDLEFVRLAIEKPQDIGGSMMIFSQIPRKLFDEVKDKNFDVDKIYELSEFILSNLSTQFYILIDKEKKIKGVLWAYANVLKNAIQINLFSIDKEYQCNHALKETLKFVRTWDSKAKIQLSTARPKVFEEKFGFKRSKYILMEIE